MTLTTINRTRKERIMEEKAQLKKQKVAKVAGVALATLIGISTLTGLSQSASACSDVYTVKQGDSLYKIWNQIPKEMHITLQQLKDANGLTSDKLDVGQVLEVPPMSLNHEHAETKIIKNSPVKRTSQNKVAMATVSGVADAHTVEFKKLNGESFTLQVQSGAEKFNKFVGEKFSVVYSGNSYVSHMKIR